MRFQIKCAMNVIIKRRIKLTMFTSKKCVLYDAVEITNVQVEGETELGARDD